MVGLINSLNGLTLNYIFQFYLLFAIPIPLRTYLTSFFSFSISIVASYFISRKYIFDKEIVTISFSEFLKFVTVNLVNLFIPLIVWYFMNIFIPAAQVNEFQFLFTTSIISAVILPFKYLIYKFYIF